MKNQTYAIVDNNGNVYAHDIVGLVCAEYLLEQYLDEMIEENGFEYANSLELEIIEN